MPDLKGKRVAILIGPQFHDEEATSPKNHLQQLGARVDLIGLERSPLTGKMGRVSVTPDRGIDEITAGEYDGIIIPGGGAPERIRVNDQAIAFVRAFWQSGRPVGAICHGPQVLISANVLAGVTATAYVGIRDDLKLAGAHYVDKEVHIDGQLVTSRKPEDLPAFNTAFADLLSGSTEERALEAVTALGLAISREKGAQEFYSAASGKMPTEALRNKFKYLALIEQGHFDQLAELFEKVTGQKPSAGLIATEISAKTVTPQISAAEALDLAMAAEQKAYEFYRKMAALSRSAKAREMFEYLASEEIEHKRMLSIDKATALGGQGHFQWATHWDVPPGMEDLW